MNKFTTNCYVSIVLLIITATLTYPQVSDSADAVGVWHMDEIIQDTIPDDDSKNPGRNNFLICHGNPTLSAGYSDLALLFDGYYDYCESYSSFVPTERLEVTAYVKFAEEDISGHIINGGSLFQLVQNGSTRKVYLYGSNSDKIKSSTLIAGKWYRIIASFDKNDEDNAFATLSMQNMDDNRPLNVFQGLLPFNWGSSVKLQIGTLNGRNDLAFRGLVDEVKVVLPNFLIECGDYGYNRVDFNRDCFTNLSDLTVIAEQWLLNTDHENEYAITDINSDRMTDLLDFRYFANDLNYSFIDTDDLIQLAGNTSDDRHRLELLRLLIPKLEDGTLVDELKLLVKSIYNWVENKDLNYFAYGKTLVDFDYSIPEDSPFFPILCFYRARAIAAVCLEYGDPYDAQIRELMIRMYNSYPNNKIARMYLGEPVVSPYNYLYHPKAPYWANVVRENIERYTDIIDWWIDNRQQADGQYGGGWDDDVEIWRTWVPIIIGFDYAKTNQAQKLLTTNMLSQTNMELGYDSFRYDVQHTSEPTADTITPMMIIEPDNSEWNERSMILADLMDNLWTGTNSKGTLQFKSIFISSDWVDTDPVNAFDSVYHPRAVQPTLLYWQRTASPYLTTLFSSWMDTWIYAAASTYLGKPSGIFPSGVYWPNGEPGGKQPDYPNWWQPHYKFYEWPSAYSYMLKTMLLTWYITGDHEYLQTVLNMAQIRREYGDIGGNEGSIEWCSANSGFSSYLADVLSKYRLLSRDDKFDDLILRDGNEYMKYLLLRSEVSFNNIITRLESRNNVALRYNFEGHTSEVRYTDRMFRFNSMLPASATMYGRRPDPGLLYSVITGEPGVSDGGSVGYFPLNGVRWLTEPREIAVFVTESDLSEFNSKIYSFRDSRYMGARFFTLSPGDYIYELNCSNGTLDSGTFEMKGCYSDIFFEVPSHIECQLKVYSHLLHYWVMNQVDERQIRDFVPYCGSDIEIYGNPLIVDGYDNKVLLFDGYEDYGRAGVWENYDSVKVEVVFRPSVLGVSQHLVDVRGVFALYIGSNDKVQWGTGSVNLTNQLRITNTDDWWYACASINAAGERASTLTNLTTGVSYTYTDTGVMLDQSGRNIYVGASKDGTEGYFHGEIDYIKISNP